MTTSGVPALHLPFETIRSEQEAAVRDRAREVRLRLSGAGFGSLVQEDNAMVDLICLTSPQANVDTIRFVADWLLWVFPLDDLCEQVFGTSPPTGPVSLLTLSALPQIVTRGVDELCSGLMTRMSTGWGEQFRYDLDSYLVHAVRYAGTSAREVLPSVTDFLVLRREESLAKPTIDLIEVASGADLPADFRRSAAWRQLIDACADVLAWTNDIHSFQKERDAGSRFNLIDVLSYNACLEDGAAYACAVDMTNQRAQQFTTSAAGLVHDQEYAALTEQTQSDALRCIRGMEHWMRGQYEWFVTTRPARYDVLQNR